jgi:hypothetical protein
MVFDVDRKTLVGGVERWALRDGPGPQHAFHLEAEVEVQVPSRVLVDDEQEPATGGRLDRSGGFRGVAEGALGPVWGEGVGGLVGHCRKVNSKR